MEELVLLFVCSLEVVCLYVFYKVIFFGIVKRFLFIFYEGLIFFFWIICVGLVYVVIIWLRVFLVVRVFSCM